jgi:prophage antirepressor-like protein
LKQRDIRRLKTEEMKFMRLAAVCSLLDHRRNENVLEDLKVDQDKKKSSQYKRKLLSQVSRMEDIGYLK